MRLYLVRHGQSTWNVDRRLQGHVSHPPLTQLGIEQARSAASALRDCPATELLSSDLTRAAQTAAEIGRALGLSVTETPLLREQSLGTLEGMTTEEAMQHYQPDSYRDPDWRPGGGESTHDVVDRVRLLLADASPRSQIWVTHGDTIRIVLAYLRGQDLTDLPWRTITNGEVILADVTTTGSR